MYLSELLLDKLYHLFRLLSLLLFILAFVTSWWFPMRLTRIEFLQWIERLDKLCICYFRANSTEVMAIYLLLLLIIFVSSFFL